MRGSLFAALWIAAASGIAHDVGAQDRPFGFRYDVQPWLLRQGCAAAECHGGALGRGGFKLSLFGGDPELDWQAIAVERGARRIDLAEPRTSLLLRKPSRALDHGGGLRLPRGSDAFTALRTWIEDGAVYGDGDAVALDALELMRDGNQLVVHARFGARREDVTARSLFTSTAPAVVAVDPSGRTTMLAPGEAWLGARFAGRDARVRVVVPFENQGRGERVAPATPLDAAWLRGLDELGLEPAPPAPPGLLVRRLHLELAGRLPTPAELHAFLADEPATRVRDCAASLLASDDFTDVATDWLVRWFELERDANGARDDAARRALRAIAAGDGSLLDALDKELANGRPLLDRLPDPRDRAELFGRAVLGVRLGCARCHDHPLDRWRRDDHLGFSALFVDPRPAAGAGMDSGALFDPATGEAATPRVLDLLGRDPRTGSPRARLRAALRDDPRAFARNVANRVILELCGHAPVEPADDHRPTNPGVQHAMLDELVGSFVSSGYRLRPLVTALANSAAFRSDSTPGAADPLRDAARARHLARREALPLDGQQLGRVLAKALRVEGELIGPTASPLARWLGLWNGDALHEALAMPGNALTLIALDDDLERQVVALSELLLTRAPRETERARFCAALRGSADRDATLRDLAHAMILSREFSSRR